MQKHEEITLSLIFWMLVLITISSMIGCSVGIWRLAIG